jgi:hypothetical protein
MKEESDEDEDVFGPPIPSDFKVPLSKPARLSQDSVHSLMSIDQLVENYKLPLSHSVVMKSHNKAVFALALDL